MNQNHYFEHRGQRGLNIIGADGQVEWRVACRPDIVMVYRGDRFVAAGFMVGGDDGPRVRGVDDLPPAVAACVRAYLLGVSDGVEQCLDQLGDKEEIDVPLPLSTRTA